MPHDLRLWLGGCLGSGLGLGLRGVDAESCRSPLLVRVI